MVLPGEARPKAGRTDAGLELELERNAHAPAVARAATGGLCRELELSSSLQHTCLLLVSELVSNAVLHSSAPPDASILLTAMAAADIVRIAVTDAGDGFDHTAAIPTRPGRGYGLYLVERSASRWGIDRVGGTRVWFELSRESA